LVRHVERKLQEVFPRSTPPRNSFVTFQSGKRRYGIRVFPMSSHAKSSQRAAAYALLLERPGRKVVSLSTVLAHFRLTPREEETLHYLLQGMTSKEIAQQMNISAHTVKAFLRLVMSKMQVTTRSGIIGKIVEISN